MGGDEERRRPFEETEMPGAEPGETTLTDAIQRRFAALLDEFSSAMAMLQDVVDVLESVTAQPETTPAGDFTRARDQAPAPTIVTVEASIDSAELADQLTDALGGIPGVRRVQVVARDTASATMRVTLDAIPTREESLLSFRDALSELPWVSEVLLAEFIGEEATLRVVATLDESAGVEPVSVVCAWCGRLLTVGGNRVSHGLCPDCAAKAATDARLPIAAAAPQTPRLIYVQRGAEYWLERHKDDEGEWVSSETRFASSIAAQTVLDGVSAMFPDDLVVLEGHDGEPERPTNRPRAPRAAAPAEDLPAPRRLRGGRTRERGDVSLRRLRQTLNMAVPVDAEILLESLGAVESLVAGVTERRDLGGDAAAELNESLRQLRDAMRAIGMLAPGLTSSRP